MKTLYMCDLCHEMFTDEEECIEHEKNAHVHVVKIAKEDSNKAMLNFDGKLGEFYPNVLKVQFTNGKEGTYHLHDVGSPEYNECPF